MRVWLVTLFLLFPSCKSGPDAFAVSLQNLCRIAGEVRADPSIQPMDRPMQIVQRFQASQPDQDLMDLMRSLATLAPELRDSRLREEAARHGLPGWTCPDLTAPNP